MVEDVFLEDRGEPAESARGAARRLADWGEGVRLFARLAMRADLRGEYGSQESSKPCFGVVGVWMPEAGDGVLGTSRSIFPKGK